MSSGLALIPQSYYYEFQQRGVNVKDYGAKGDGVTNDSSAFQAANNYLSANGGGIMLVPPGTYMCNFIIDSYVKVQGSGIDVTILKSVANSNADVIQGRNFTTLTGKTAAAAENDGVRNGVIRDLTIDGNKANNTAGYGIRVWGRYLNWKNILVKECVNDGIWTEFSTIPTPVDNQDPEQSALESRFENIKSIFNNGNGWTYNGPHDSDISNYTAFGNTGYALKQVGSHSSLVGRLWNSWSNGNSYYFTTGATVDHMIASGGTTGIETAAGSGGMCLTNLTIGSCTTGMILRGTSNMIYGYITGVTGDAVELDGMGASILDIVVDNTPNVFKIVSHGNANYIRANVAIAGTNTIKNGNFSTNDTIDIVDNADVTKNFTQYASNSQFNVGGWNPKFPASNGTLLTNDKFDPQTATTTLNGTTAGTIVWAQYLHGTVKRFVAYLNGYQNNTATQQTIAYPTPFTTGQGITSQPSGLNATTSNSALLLPTSMASPISGVLVVDGL